jgi:Transposase DDE domain
VSQRKRKRVEEPFGWVRTVGGGRKLRYIGQDRNRAWFKMATAVYNLIRITALDTAIASLGTGCSGRPGGGPEQPGSGDQTSGEPEADHCNATTSGAYPEKLNFMTLLAAGGIEERWAVAAPSSADLGTGDIAGQR